MTDQVEVTSRRLDTGDTVRTRITDSYVLTLAGTAQVHWVEQTDPGVHVITVTGVADPGVADGLVDGRLEQQPLTDQYIRHTLPFPPDPT